MENTLDLLEKLRGKLVASCQPVDGGPMDFPNITAAMALAAEAGGAAGLRIEGIANLKAVRPRTALPIIGIVKHDLNDSDVRITPLPEHVVALGKAGADIIAYDATERPRPFSTRELLKVIKTCGALAMADCASFEDGQRALAEGADLLGTTLSGYAYKILSPEAPPDLSLISKLKSLGAFVVAEGRYNSPALAGEAMKAGADSVTVGSAITRIEHITAWFAERVSENANT